MSQRPSRPPGISLRRGASGRRRCLYRASRALVESLECRRLLAGNPVITEFMADNATSITDGNGAHSDWIELQNQGDAAIDLAGWHLTDNPQLPEKWTFPSQVLDPGQFLIVFASGNGTPDAAGNLHTSFALNAGGEYLALTRPDLTVASEFGAGGTDYPNQLQDVSYGPGTILDNTILVGTGAEVRATVPANGSLGSAWTASGFNDASWTSGASGVGYDTGGIEDIAAPPVAVAHWTADDLLGSISSGATVSNWTDSLAGLAAQRSGRPTFRTNVINGHAVVRFDPSNGNDQLRVAAADNPLAGAGDFSIVVVYRTSSAGEGTASQWYSNSGIVDAEQSGATADWGLAINDSGQIGAGLGSPDVTAYSAAGTDDGSAHIAIYTRLGNKVSLYVDGGDGVSTTGSAAARNTADLVFGSLQTNINYFTGDLAEVEFFSGAFTTTAAYDFASALGGEYGITVQAPAGTVPQVVGQWTADDLNAQADGSRVAAWTSPVGGSTATATGNPLLEKNELNGHSVVRFDPSNGTDQLRVPAASNSMASADDFTIALVFRADAPGLGSATQWYNNSGLVDAEIGGITDDWGLALNGSGQVGAGMGNPDTTTYSQGGLADGLPHVVVFTRTGASTALYIDGGAAITGIAGTATRTYSDMVFGALQTNINDFTGDIAEIRIYSSALDESTADVVAKEMSARYGIPEAPDPYDPLIGLDLQAQMLDVNASAYVRARFEAADPSQFDHLHLRMRYDDGFVAYINGIEVARRNAPSVLAYDSAAVTARADQLALQPEEIDLSQYIGLIQPGSDNVLAIQLLNAAPGNPDALLVPELVGVHTLSGDAYFDQPTPGAPNGNGYLGYVRDVSFSVDRGFYSTPQAVVITTSTPGATIIYTLDGSEPAPSNGIAIAAPDASTPPTVTVVVDGTTTLRATAIADMLLATNVDTETYIFVDDVLMQGNVQPAGAYWDTAMDPNVVNAQQTYSVSQALTAIPTMSLVLPDADMFGPDGIYTNPLQRGSAWERATSIEWIDPNDPASQMQIDAGIRIEGGVSREPSRPKKSFRLFFRGKYGAGKLDFPVFGDYPVSSFDTLVLRGGHNYSWANAGGTPVTRGEYLRDEFARDVMEAMDGTAAHGTFVQLYINGLYWGLYNLTEQPDASWASSHFGGQPEDYDVLQPDNTGGLEVLSGDSTAWNNLFATADAAMADGVINDAEYDGLGQLVNVDSVIDFMLSIFYRGDLDSPTLIGNGVLPRNFYAIRNRTTDGRFMFQTWDGELSMDSATVDRTETYGQQNPGRLFQQLRTNAEFRQRVADHVQKQFYNGGVFAVDASGNMPAERYQGLMNVIDQAIVGESARWGDALTEPAATRDTDWVNETNWLLNTYFPQRTSIVLSQLKVDFTMLNTSTATFAVNGTAQHGGQVDAGALLTLQNPNSSGAIYYTLDGSDPRLAGGGLSPAAIPYAGAIVLDHNLDIRVRIQDGATWSAIDAAQFSIHAPAGPGNLAVTEIMYNPVDPTPAEETIDPAWTNNDFEYIELQNTGPDTIDLLDVQFDTGIKYTFGNDSLAPGARMVLVKNLAAFRARYGASIAVEGVYSGSLANDGESIRLLAAGGATITDFSYSDSGSWPGRADGKGSSLEAVLTSGDYSDSDNWRSSYEYNGTPGSAGAGPQDAVVINEVLSNPDATQLDAIELYNTAGSPIDLSGWFLSDSSGNYKKYRIPDGTVLDGHDYIVFDESNFNPTPLAPLPNDFALSGAHGDQVWLMKATPGGTLLAFADSQEFDAAANGESFGRWPNGSGRLYPMRSVTLGEPNSGPRIGPVAITELMPAPAAGNAEYVEIQNISGGPLDIAGWTFDDGISFTFPAGTGLASDEPVVVVPFDPSDTAAASAFRAAYNVDPVVRLFGPYGGSLSNTGERIRLARPDVPPLDEPDYTPFVLVDEVNYTTSAPWPEGPGSGEALTRLGVALYGDDPANWTATAPSVGQVATGHAYFQGNVQHLYSTAPILDSLTLTGGSAQVALAPGGGMLSVGDLRISAGSSLDLANNDLLVRAAGSPDAEMIRQLLQNGATGQTPSIFSTVPVNSGQAMDFGILDNSQVHLSKWQGQTISDGYAFNQIVIAYTPRGDANLDGQVTPADYASIIAGMGHSGGWMQGDVTHDGVVTVDDYAVVMANLGSTAAPVAGPLLATVMAPTSAPPIAIQSEPEVAAQTPRPPMPASRSIVQRVIAVPRRPAEPDAAPAVSKLRWLRSRLRLFART